MPYFGLFVLDISLFSINTKYSRLVVANQWHTCWFFAITESSRRFVIIVFTYFVYSLDNHYKLPLYLGSFVILLENIILKSYLESLLYFLSRQRCLKTSQGTKLRISYINGIYASYIQYYASYMLYICMYPEIRTHTDDTKFRIHMESISISICIGISLSMSMSIYNQIYVYICTQQQDLS